VIDDRIGVVLPVATVRRRLDSIVVRPSNALMRHDCYDRPAMDASAEAPRSMRGGLLTTHAPKRTNVRALRRIRNALVYARAMVRALVVNPRVLWHAGQRAILWGKIRRALICLIPGLALHLKQKYGLAGGCVSCGTSCNLLFRCPHWNPSSHLCSIYDDRPMTCRQFPVTPADLRDRSLASGTTDCGYRFVRNDSGTRPSWQSDEKTIMVRHENIVGQPARTLLRASRGLARSAIRTKGNRP
jgi:hypothetical protein